jgi:hypothetical protein
MYMVPVVSMYMIGGLYVHDRLSQLLRFRYRCSLGINITSSSNAPPVSPAASDVAAQAGHAHQESRGGAAQVHKGADARVPDGDAALRQVVGSLVVAGELGEVVDADRAPIGDVIATPLRERLKHQLVVVLVDERACAGKPGVT